MKMLAFAGSIRSASFNRGLIQAAKELALPEMTFEIYEISDIPLYDADDDGEIQPEPVVRFKDAIAAADALLIATPEYNASFSGVLKNAIDWASRPLSETPLMNKPAALMGASGGMSGTIRAQAALLPVLASCGVRVLPKPGVVVRQARALCDETGQLTDDVTRDQIGKLVADLAEFARRLKE
jgi:chromate reductase, NAD(P)H dehydrogenase (quinone)